MNPASPSRPSDETLEKHHVLIGSDNGFQRRARLLQALWREREGLPVGDHRGRPLGSRLPMPFARNTLRNYITEGIRDVVRAEVLDPVASADKLYGAPRIFNDLLSSQPLCFNLFGELQRDLTLAARVLRALAEDVERVTAIRFEHSPGRGDARYTDDRSAFDVFVEFVGTAGERGFLGIEVKYHENLKDKPARHRPRYDEVAAEMGCFRRESLDRLRAQPLQQIWRDHLLTGSLLLNGDFDRGRFVFLFPGGNTRCGDAVAAYEESLTDATTFTSWTLERCVEALRRSTSAPWVETLAQRYLGSASTSDD